MGTWQSINFPLNVTTENTKATENGEDCGKLKRMAHIKEQLPHNSRSLLLCRNMSPVLSDLLISKDKLETQNFRWNLQIWTLATSHIFKLTLVRLPLQRLKKTHLRGFRVSEPIAFYLWSSLTLSFYWWPERGSNTTQPVSKLKDDFK